MPRPDEAQQPLGVPGRLPEDLQPTQSAELAAAMREFDQRFGAKDIPSLVEPPRGGTPASAAPLNAAAQFVAPPVASPAAAAPQTVAPPVVVPPVAAAPSAASEASAL